MLKCHATFNHALFTCISGCRSTLHCYPLTPFCLLNDFWQEIVSFVNFTWPQSNQLEYVLLGTEYTSYVTMKMNIRLSPTSTPTIAPISKSNIAGWVNDCELVNVKSPYWGATLQAKARVTFPSSLKPQHTQFKISTVCTNFHKFTQPFSSCLQTIYRPTIDNDWLWQSNLLIYKCTGHCTS